jgi:hypothetical protein
MRTVMKYITVIRLSDLIHTAYFVFIVLILSGCQKVINVDLNNAAPRIVIEGIITDRPGPYSVTISESGSYFNQPDLPPVTGAEVIITDNMGVFDTLKEVTPGVYFTSKTKGIPGRIYTLKVISGNNIYSGTSTMFSHVEIDSLSLSKNQSQHFDLGGGSRNDPNVEIDCYFRDPFEKNFYRVKVFTDDTTRNEFYRLFDDQYSNGLEVGLRVAHANANHTYRIELLSLDKVTFGYYRTLEDAIHSNPIFGSTPANPTTNLNNGALGYFGAFAVSSRTITVTQSMIEKIR